MVQPISQSCRDRLFNDVECRKSSNICGIVCRLALVLVRTGR